MSAATCEPFVHPALIYRGDAAYLEGVVPFLQAGLDARGAVAVAVPGPNLALLRDALGPRAASVVMVDMTEAGRNPGRIIPNIMLGFANAHAGQPVSIVGEPIWSGRSDAEYQACAQHEALINVAFAGRDVTILCPYDGTNLDPVVLRDAARTHPIVIEAGDTYPSRTYEPGRVVDTYNQPLLTPPEPYISRFLFNRDNLAQVRGYTVTHALRLGMSRSRADDVEVAVGELAANSVQHGGGRGTLEIWTEGSELLCQVRDAGTINDSLHGRRPAAPDGETGHGLLRVNRLADLVLVHTEPGRTTTRIHFQVEGPIGPAAPSSLPRPYTPPRR